MILVYKIIKTKNTSNIFKAWNWNVDIISIKVTSTTVGFMPYVNFKDPYKKLCLLSGKAR